MSNDTQVDPVLQALHEEIRASEKRKKAHYDPNGILFSRRFPDIPYVGNSHPDLNIVIRRTFIAMSVIRNDGVIRVSKGEKVTSILVFGSEEVAVARAMAIYEARKARQEGKAPQGQDTVPLRKKPRR